jgi:acyl dehydratase
MSSHLGDRNTDPAEARRGPYPRERFRSEVKLTPAAVAMYADAAGDTNPVHRDPAFAASTRTVETPCGDVWHALARIFATGCPK